MRLYKCFECDGIASKIYISKDSSPSGDDELQCALCGSREPGFQSIEVEEVKEGSWIYDYGPEAYSGGWKCSVCGYRTTYGQPPHCMHCGAKLKKHTEEKT